MAVSRDEGTDASDHFHPLVDVAVVGWRKYPRIDGELQHFTWTGV